MEYKKKKKKRWVDGHDDMDDEIISAVMLR